MRMRLGTACSVAITSTRRTASFGTSASGRDLGVDRHEIVVAGDLQAVTRVVDEHDSVRTTLGNLGGEVLQHLDHLVMIEVGRLDDFEAGRVQELADRPWRHWPDSAAR